MEPASVSRWRTVTEQRIDTFAGTSDDHEWIDAERYVRKSSFQCDAIPDRLAEPTCGASCSGRQAVVRFCACARCTLVARRRFPAKEAMMSNKANSGNSGAGKGATGSGKAAAGGGSATGRGPGPGNAGGWPSTTGRPSGTNRSNAAPARSR